MPILRNAEGVEVDNLEQLLADINEDDRKAILARNGTAPAAYQPPADEKMISWMINRHPYAGGDYYRAFRPAVLTSAHFGWHTALADKMVTLNEDPDGKLGFVTPASDNPKVFFSDVLVIRPVANWRLSNVEQMHANGQKIIADLDDNPFEHEDLSNPELTLEEDYFLEWFPYVDAWLVSTKYLADKLRERGMREDRIYYAPNLYDPTAFNAEPKPSRRLGTRLWLANRQNEDVKMYDELVYPLLDKLDLSFTHIGVMEDVDVATVGRKARRSFGWDTPRLIERPSVLIPEMAKELALFSIGAIMMGDNEFNRAKTETHAAELGLAGLPLVAASNHELYRNIPGRVEPTAEAVEDRVRYLLDPDVWHAESKRIRTWARAVAVRHESQYLESVLAAVNAVLK